MSCFQFNLKPVRLHLCLPSWGGGPLFWDFPEIWSKLYIELQFLLAEGIDSNNLTITEINWCMIIREIIVFKKRILRSAYTCCKMQSSSMLHQVMRRHRITNRLLNVNTGCAYLRKKPKILLRRTHTQLYTYIYRYFSVLYLELTQMQLACSMTNSQRNSSLYKDSSIEQAVMLCQQTYILLPPYQVRCSISQTIVYMRPIHASGKWCNMNCKVTLPSSFAITPRFCNLGK
jgi:hypothetical protein